MACCRRGTPVQTGVEFLSEIMEARCQRMQKKYMNNFTLFKIKILSKQGIERNFYKLITDIYKIHTDDY